MYYFCVMIITDQLLIGERIPMIIQCLDRVPAVVKVAWDAGGRRPPPQIHGRMRPPTSGIPTDARGR